MSLPSGLPDAPPIVVIRDRLVELLSADTDLMACIESPIQKYDTAGSNPASTAGTKPTLCLVYAQEDIDRETLGGRGAGTHRPEADFWLLVYKPAAATRTSGQETLDLMSYATWYAKMALLKNFRDTSNPQLWHNIVFYTPASAWESGQNFLRTRTGFTVKQNRVRHP